MSSRTHRLLGVSLLALAMLTPASLAGQERTVEGRVVSSDGTPIENALVEVVQGSGSWVLSSADGTFRLTRAPGGSFELLVSRTGHLTQRVAVNAGAASTAVTLPIDPVGIPGVEVVGIRSQLVGKTRESVVNLPQSVSVVDHTVFESQASQSLGDVVRNVAGIIQSDGSSAPGGFYSLRGFYSDSNGNFRKNGAQLFKSAELLQPNVERVEVLKGPSSVFFGQLDPGGVVNLVTKRPQPVAHAEVDLRTGSFGLIDGVLDLTGPLGSGNTAYRMIASARRGGEFVTEGDRRRFFAAPSIRFSNPGRWLLDVDVELSQASGLTNPGLKAPDGTFAGMDDLPADLFLGDDDAEYDRTQASVQIAGELDVSSAVQLRSLVSISDYDWSDVLTALRSFEADSRTLNRRAQRTETEQTDLHLDLFGTAGFQTGSARHATTAGVDFQGSSFSRDQFNRDMDPIDIFAPVSNGVPTDLDEVSAGTTETDVVGAYLSHSVEIGAVRLLGGVRRTSFSQESQSGDALEADDWSASAGVVVRVGDATSLFGSFSESFAPTLFTRDGTLFDPSFGTQYEIGAKVGLMGGRVLGTVTLFDLENTGVLSFFLDENSVFQVEQGGTHGSRGVELEVNGRVMDRLYVLASYAYLDGEVREDPAYDEGTPLGGSPEHSGSLWADFQATPRLSIGAGVFHVDERKAFLSSQLFMPAHTLVDASIAYALTSAIDLRLVGRNLGDARHYQGGSGPFGRPGATRSIVLEAKARLR